MSALTVLSMGIWSAMALYTAVKVVRSVRIVPQKTELVVERLGRYSQTLPPGFHILVPFIDRVAFTVDMKEDAIDVPGFWCFTRDNVRVEVDGVLYISVMNAKQASYGVQNARFAAIQLAQTTTRAVIGTLELDRTFEERDAINSRVISALNEVSAAWGIKVHRYEVKNLVPPMSVKDAMERQMSAERERRALAARSEGEKQARINDSEGKKQEFINRSLGEMQRRINEAEGKAEEILALARATADSLRTIGAAITTPGGSDAVELRLAQQYLQKLGTLGDGSARVILPADLTNVDELLASVRLHAVPRAADRVPVPVPVPQTAGASATATWRGALDPPREE